MNLVTQQDEQQSIARLQQLMQRHFPVDFQELDVRESKIGLIIVDVVNGFATVGSGPLAPARQNHQVSRMISETNKLAKAFERQHKPILAFLDTHTPGKPEHPYPPHCEFGTGQEDLVPDLNWLNHSAEATLVRKDCINGFIGSYQSNGQNTLISWVEQRKIHQLLVVGICTDICVMDLVLTLLSARNHGILGKVQNIFVYEPGCATYDLTSQDVAKLALPPTSIHPQIPAHHMGLYFMASRGAVLLDRIIV
ncbi:MAG TPA: isochorismatase family protein [Alphaproteobacteria bacterium]|jgi:nicotinamidase-related amidase|nr:isochorismatase family protein [Alphaproteobacteria bacterium]